jgi:peptidoglycan/xylan/chitin deacetylase (PgdA/CDA1 family)
MRFLRLASIPEPAISAGWSPSPLVRASVGLHALALLGVAAAPAAWPWLLGAVAANHVGLGATGMWPRGTLLGPNLARLPPAGALRRQVALTFDDGPDPRVTPAVLDLLEQVGARASFFCIGRRAAAHPALVREMVRRGHSVENHSDRHPNAFACLPPTALMQEIGRAQARLADIAGVAPRFFRPPMGLRSPLLDPVLARLGLRHVSWTRRGYDTVSDDASRVLRRLADGLAAGDVLLLHDGAAWRHHDGGPMHARGRPAVVLDVLPALLDRLAAAGLAAVTLATGVKEETGGTA